MKKNYLLLFIIFIVISPFVNAQPQLFSRVLESNNSVQIADLKLTANNTFFGVGYNYNYKGLLFEMDSSAQVIWARTYENVSSGNPKPVQFNNMLPTDDSGFLLTGHTFNQNTGWEDGFIMKIDSEGETIWSKAISTDLRMSLNEAFQTVDGGFIVSGYFTHASAPYNTIVLVRLDEGGNMLWTRELIVGNSMNKAYSVKEMADGSIMMIGHYRSLTPTQSYAFLAKLSDEGEAVWTQHFFDEGSYNWCQGNDFVPTPTGFLVNMNLGPYLMMGNTDFDGNLQSYLLYRNMGSPSFYDQAPKFHPVNDGGYVMTLGDDYNSSFIKTDSLGNVLWKDDLSLMAIDGCATNNHEYLIFGNGPIMGVKKQKDTQYSIGLIQVDTVGNGIDCAGLTPLFFPSEDTISTETITAASSSIVSSISEVILETSTEVISTREGCIDFVGNISESDWAKIELFPNPTKGSFTISIDRDLKGRLIVFDAFGHVVLSQSILEKVTKLDLTGQASGVYFYQFIVDDQLISNGKVVLAY